MRIYGIIHIMKETEKSDIVRSLVAAVAVAAVVSLILPLQAFLGNASLYAFGLPRLVVELSILFAAMSAVLFAVLWASARWLRGALHGLLLGAAFCVYLESGLLSAGLPEINGAYSPELAVASRGVMDCCVWAALLVGGLAASRWLRTRGHYVALALLVLGAASLFDVRRESASPSGGDVTGTGLSSGFEWQLDVVDNFRFSRERNVLMFILDSMPANVSADLVKSSPDLAGKFSGFVAFTNNVGMHDCTKRGLPGIMTGRYFDPRTTSKAEFPMSMYGADSFLVPYVSAGAEVSFVPDFLPYGYTNARIERRAQVKGRQKHGWAALLRRSKEVPYLSLFDVTVFRIAPYVAKAPFLFAKIRHDPMFGQDESGFWYEHAMYPRLSAAGFTDAKLVLGVFHTRGAHPPLVFDQYGNRLGTVGWGRESLGALVRNPLYNLGKLMDALREKGVYDKSLIVVAADHGVGIAPHGEGHHPSESAILWVKPEGSAKKFAYNDTPTGYANVAAFMRLAVKERPDAHAAARALHVENRLFRYQDPNDDYHDIVVGPDGGIVSKEDL